MKANSQREAALWFAAAVAGLVVFGFALGWFARDLRRPNCYEDEVLIYVDNPPRHAACVAWDDLETYSPFAGFQGDGR